MASAATIERLCAEFDSPPEHITAAVGLLEQKATPAFLARYRRSELGNLPEDRLLAIAERLHLLTELEQRRQTILQQAEERGRRTPELEATLATTADQDLLDDYYQSMRPRRRGIAMQMEEKGLQPLALAIQHRQFGEAATETAPAPRPAVQQAPAETARPKQPATDEATPTAAEGAESASEAPSANEGAAPATDDPAAAAAPPASEPVASTGSDAAATEPAAEQAAASTAEAAATEPAAAEAAASAAAVPEPTPAEAAEAAPTPTDVPAQPEPGQPEPGQPESGQPELEAAIPPAPPPAAAADPVPDVDLRKLAEPYLSEEHGITSPEAALEGALLILADKMVHEPSTRARFRDELRRGILRAKPVNPDGDAGRHKQFFDFAEPINRIPSGRMLALRRAEREKILRLELTLPEGRHRDLLRQLHAKDTVPGTQLGDFYDLVFDNAAHHLQDLCGNDVRRRLKEKADREAMRTYGRNLRSQLLAPPLGHKKVLSMRSSGKAIWAVLLAEDGSVAEHKTLPTDSDEQKKGALELLVELIKTNEPAAIALPHGRRQAGSEKIVAELRAALGETPMPMVVPVDEAASTIFATSTTGKKAIPGVEVGARTAISLGRRLQDPLLELARMEVRTLGLGQTLDEVHQGTLQRELARVKSDCIAQVGCDLNTAGKELLAMLPGIHHELAQAIVAHRKQNGGFPNRAALRDVAGIDERVFRNIAGFLRISGGDEPLDATAIHPDDYAIVRAAAAQKGCDQIELFGKGLRDVDPDPMTSDDCSRAHVIAVLQQIQRGNDDGRGELIATTNEGVNTIADLHADRQLKGRVASVTEFGAFVDLGIGHDGLVHISQIPGHRMRDPSQMLRVGEVVDVWVLGVDQEKQKISLSMHQPRHLAEGRLQTIGERMEQGKGRRRGRSGPREPAQEGRRPGSGGGRPGMGGGRRGPGEGGRGFGGGRGPGDRDSRGPRDRDRGPRRGGSGEQRIYTVEAGREVEDKRTHKGEVTSLSSLRNLLSKPDDSAGKKD